MHQTRSDHHQVKQGKKILKKVKGAWVTALAAGLLVSSLVVNVDQVASAQNVNQTITIEAMLEKETLEERLESVYTEDHLFVVNTGDTVADLLEAMKAYDFELDESIAEDKELIDFIEALELEDFKQLNNLTEEEAEELEVGQLLEVRLEVLKFAGDQGIQIDFTDERIKVEVDTNRMIEILTEQNSAAVMAPSVLASNAVATQPEVSVPGEVEKPTQPQLPAKPEVPTEREVPKTPEVPEIPVVPEVPETPETPIIVRPEGDTIVKERQWLDLEVTVLSEEPIFGGKTGEEVIEGDIASQEEVTNWEESLPDEVTTETVIVQETQLIKELVPEIQIEMIEQEFEVGTDEVGNPIYDTQLVPVETTVMVEKEKEVMIDVEKEQEVVIPGAVQDFSRVIETITKSFDKVVRYDNTLAEGETELIQAGVNGQTQVTTLTVTQAGELIDTKTDTVVLAETLPEIMRVGTKKQNGTIVTQEEVKTQTFAEVERLDGSLYTDESKLIQAGSNGFIKQVVEVTQVGEDEQRVVLSEKTLAATDQITAIGTKPIYTTGTDSLTKEILFEEEVHYVNSEEEFSKVIQKGVNGVLTETYEVDFEKGVEIERQLIDSVVTTAPIKAILQVGKGNITTQTRTETKVVDFKIQEIINKNLVLGEMKVIQEGINGVETVTYLDVFIDDKLTDTKVENRKITTQPVDKIIEVGIKEVPNPNDIVIRYNKGDYFGNYTLKDDTVFNVSEIANESENSRYQKAQLNDRLHTMLGVTSSGEVHDIGIRMDDVTVNAFNDGTIFDHSIFNDRMLELVNELRERVAVNKLEYGEGDLQEGTDLRAQEMAEYGSQRFENQPHTRPDGTGWSTAFSDVRPLVSGENTAQASHRVNYYQVLSEKALAETFFNQWASSPGHYGNMISNWHNGFATAVRIGPAVTEAQGESMFNYLIAVQIFQNR